MKNPMIRATSLLISFALVHISFGPEAWAQTVRRVSAPLGGNTAASVGSMTGQRSGGSSAVAPLAAGPVALSAPSAIPSLPTSASVAPSAISAIPALSAASTPAPSSSEETTASAAAPGTNPSAPATASAPKTSEIKGRIALRFAELTSFFGIKTAQSVDSAPSYSSESGLARSENLDPQTDGDRAPPTPPAPPKPEGKGWFGLGLVAATLLGAMLTMQVGLEAQGSAMAQLTENAFGDFSILAQVSIFAQIGSMVGQQLAAGVISKLGLAKTYYVAHFLRAISIGTMVFMLGNGMMPLSLMYLFYAANGIMTGIAATADGTLRKIIIGSAPGSQEKFRTIWQFTAEIIGVIAPIAFSAMVVSVGPSIVTGIYPATIALALMLLIAKKVLPSETIARLGEKTGFTQTVRDGVNALVRSFSHPFAMIGGLLRAAGGAATAFIRNLKGAFLAAGRGAGSAAAHPGATLRGLLEWFKGTSMYKGFQFVWHTPALRYSFLGAATFDIMNVFLYRLFAPGYGKLIAGAAGMSPIAGMVVGLFSFGGLITAIMLLSLQRKLKTLASKNEMEAAESQRKSVLRWMLLGVPALLLLATFALNLPSLGTAVALPAFLKWAGALTVPAAAMVLFGFFQVAASIKLNAFFIDSLPDPKADPANKDKVQQAISFEGSAMTAMSIIGMLAMKPMFGHLTTFNPFPMIAIATVPLALGLLFVQRKLAAATKK